MVNSPLIRPYFLGVWHWGGPLGSHDEYCIIKTGQPVNRTSADPLKICLYHQKLWFSNCRFQFLFFKSFFVHKTLGVKIALKIDFSNQPLLKMVGHLGIMKAAFPAGCLKFSFDLCDVQMAPDASVKNQWHKKGPNLIRNWWWYCWNPAPVEVGSLSHHLQGFIHPT